MFWVRYLNWTETFSLIFSTTYVVKDEKTGTGGSNSGYRYLLDHLGIVHNHGGYIRV
jgi:hypothetical protein